MIEREYKFQLTRNNYLTLQDKLNIVNSIYQQNFYYKMKNKPVNEQNGMLRLRHRIEKDELILTYKTKNENANMSAAYIRNEYEEKINCSLQDLKKNPKKIVLLNTPPVNKYLSNNANPTNLAIIGGIKNHRYFLESPLSNNEKWELDRSLFPNKTRRFELEVETQSMEKNGITTWLEQNNIVPRKSSKSKYGFLLSDIGVE